MLQAEHFAAMQWLVRLSARFSPQCTSTWSPVRIHNAPPRLTNGDRKRRPAADNPPESRMGKLHRVPRRSSDNAPDYDVPCKSAWIPGGGLRAIPRRSGVPAIQDSVWGGR